MVQQASGSVIGNMEGYRRKGRGMLKSVEKENRSNWQFTINRAGTPKTLSAHRCAAGVALYFTEQRRRAKAMRRNQEQENNGQRNRH